MTIGFFFSLYMASCSVAAKPFTVNASKGSDIHILGDTELGITIATIAIGDINGDRVNDIIIAGRGSSHVSVIFGRKTFSKVIQFSETIKPDIRITSIPYNHQPNPLLHVGDLNGDGIEDLFLPHANGVQVYFGRTHWPKHINAKAFPADLYIQTADIVDAEHTFGYSFVTTGDINGDGRIDLLFTRTVFSFPPKPRVWKAQSQPVIWLFLGRKQWPSVIDLSKQPADMVILAEQPSAESHTSRQVLLTDLNDDGFDDIIVGAWGRSYGGMFLYYDEGPWDKGWIISGSAQLPATLSLAAKVARPLDQDKQKRNEPTVVRMAPSELGMIFGAGMTAGDVTGDGIKDLVLNMFKERGRERELWRPCLLPGRSDFFAKEIGNPLTRCQFISGSPSLDNTNPYGTQPLFIGDFNGDHRDDVFLRLGDPELAVTGLLGRDFAGASIDISLNDKVTILPTKLKDSMHPIFIQMALGDVNGDQHADLFMVEPLGGEKTDGHIGPGAVYVVFGRKVSRESDLKKENIP